jgi:hypothetical protein
MININKLISYGGGVNSTAMIIMLLQQGENYPIVMADTGNEQPETYHYLSYFSDYLQKRWDTNITIIRPDTHPQYYDKRIAKHTIDSIESYCLKLGVVPFVCKRWCTKEFKIYPIQKWGENKGIFIHLIAFSWDEINRAKNTFNEKYKQEYPLIGAVIDRKQCEIIIKNEGLEIPKKSSCWFCPYQKISELKALHKTHPDLFQRGIDMEENASKKEGRKITIRTDNFALSEMKEGWDQENPLFPELVDYSRHDCYMCHL